MDEDKKPQEDEDVSSTPSDGVTEESSQEDGKGRTAEDRINELLSKNKETMEKLDSATNKISDLETRLDSQPIPAPATTVAPAPDVQKAIDFLKKEGKFVDAQELETRIRGIQDRMVLNSSHQRLEGIYDGEDGRPKYDRSKVEDFMRKSGIYDPEAAYERMYKSELTDWTIKKYESDRKKKPYVARPSSSAGQTTEDQTLTRDKIQEWLDNPTPANRAKYEQNRDKILKLMAQQKL